MGLERVVSIFQNMEDTSALLKPNCEPMAHKTEIFTKAIISSLNQVTEDEQSTFNLYLFASSSFDDVLQQCWGHFVNCPMQALLLQVATFITPSYK